MNSNAPVNPAKPVASVANSIKTRRDFKRFYTLTTRWMDNDVYGHVNNVTYYSWFDTAVNQYLISEQVLDAEHGQVIGLVIETQCNYFAPIAFPDEVTVGFVVSRLGNTSVRYELGIFRNDEQVASAQGHFIHVYVDRQHRRPVPLPGDLRSVLTFILSDSDDAN